MRLAALIAVAATLALPLSGCGDSGEGITESETTALSDSAVIQTKWEHTADCERPAGASRWGCSVGAYRCQSVVTDRGWSTSCSKPGRSVSFTVRP